MLAQLVAALKDENCELEIKVDGKFPKRLIVCNGDKRFVVYKMIPARSETPVYYMIDGDGDYIHLVSGSEAYKRVTDMEAELPFLEACNMAIHELRMNNVNIETKEGARKFRKIIGQLFIHIT